MDYSADEAVSQFCKVKKKNRDTQGLIFRKAFGALVQGPRFKGSPKHSPRTMKI